MPLTLAKITENTVATRFTYADETVNVTYRPAAVTEKTLADLQGFTNIEKLSNADVSGIVAGIGDLNRLIVRMVASWDLEGNDGAMYPITEDSLAELPLDFRIAVFGAVFEAIQGNGSAQTVSQ